MSQRLHSSVNAMGDTHHFGLEVVWSRCTRLGVKNTVFRLSQVLHQAPFLGTQCTWKWTQYVERDLCIRSCFPLIL